MSLYAFIQCANHLKVGKTASSLKNYVTQYDCSKTPFTTYGYINLSCPAGTQTLRYFLFVDDLLNTTFNSSDINYIVNGLFSLTFYKVASTTAFPFTGTSMRLNNYVLGSSNSSLQLLNVQQTIYNVSFAIYLLQWSGAYNLLNYPGVHQYLLNVSVTPCSVLGPFDFHGKDVIISFE